MTRVRCQRTSADLRNLRLDDLDRRATVIILRRSCNNFAAARANVLKEIYRPRRCLTLDDTYDKSVAHKRDPARLKSQLR